MNDTPEILRRSTVQLRDCNAIITEIMYHDMSGSKSVMMEISPVGAWDDSPVRLDKTDILSLIAALKRVDLT